MIPRQNRVNDKQLRDLRAKFFIRFCKLSAVCETLRTIESDNIATTVYFAARASNTLNIVFNPPLPDEDPFEL